MQELKETIKKKATKKPSSNKKTNSTKSRKTTKKKKTTKGVKLSNPKLELWQKAFVAAAFGFVDVNTDLRRFTDVLLVVAATRSTEKLD